MHRYSFGQISGILRMEYAPQHTAIWMDGYPWACGARAFVDDFKAKDFLYAVKRMGLYLVGGFFGFGFVPLM